MKWLTRILLILIAVAGLVIGALLLMPGDKLARILSEQVKAQTGRDLTLSGDVRLSFWPVLGMETGPVAFGNAKWAGPEPMLSAKSLAIGVDARALLSGDIRVKRVLAEDPVLRLERNGGRGNWELASLDANPSPAASARTSTARPSSVILEQLGLVNARLIYVENGVTQMDFSAVDLSASWPEVTAPMRLKAAMPVPGGTVEVSLDIPDLPTFSVGKVTPMSMAMTAPGGEVRFDGRVNLAGEMEGKTLVRTKSTETFLAAFGQGGVNVPTGLGRVADISGQMTYTRDGRISLRDMQVILDHNRFIGEADIAIGNPPQVTARLSAGDLDLTQAFGGTSTTTPDASSTGSTPRSDDGWSTEPIDASALALANGEIWLRADSIALPELTLGPSDLVLGLDRSRAVLGMEPATLFSGKLTGQVVANNRNGLSVGGDLSAEGIDLKQALMALGGIERLSGTASGKLRFLGVGQSEDQIMKSLSGEGALNVGKGVIQGIDLDRLMGRGEGAGGVTVFNSLTASFTVRNGDLMNDDLLMQLDNFRADGSGRVGLGRRDIDYLFTPVALRANSGSGIAIPVRIVGPWSAPSIKPDLSKVIEATTGEKLKELEQEAKDKALKKVGEELDTTITDSEQIEDALKKKLEDEARKGLLKLLGRD